MSRAEEIRRKAEQTAERRKAPEDQKPAATGQQMKDKPVRKTVDLPPVDYQRLTAWCAETASYLGVTRITGQAVMAQLVRRLLADPDLATALRDDLAADRRRTR